MTARRLTILRSRRHAFGLAMIVFAGLVCATRASIGRPSSEAIIEAKVVITQNLVLDTIGRDVGIFTDTIGGEPMLSAVLKMSDAKKTGFLQLGIFNDGTPAIRFDREIAGKKGSMNVQIDSSGYSRLDLESPLRQARLSLTAEKDDVPRLYLISGGRARLSMIGPGRNDDNSGLALWDRKRGPVMVFGNNRGAAHLSFYHGDTNAISRLHLPGALGPRLEWYDRDGHPLLEAIVDDAGEPTVSFTDPVTRISKRL
jgi:hypothetical protein